jgi:hypothetical protein
MARAYFIFVLLPALGWGFGFVGTTQGAQAAVTNAQKVGERAVVAREGHVLKGAQTRTAKVRTKARPKTWPKPAPGGGISPETRQRLFELQLLDALRSARPL